MKLYSHIVVIAGLMSAVAAPAFCQKDLTDQAAQLAEDAARMAKQATVLSLDQDFRFDNAKLDEQMAKMAAQLDSAKLDSFRFDSAKFDSFKFDSSKLADIAARAADMANKAYTDGDFSAKMAQFDFNKAELDSKLAQLDFQLDSKFDLKDFAGLDGLGAKIADQIDMAFLQAPTAPMAPMAPGTPMPSPGPAPRAKIFMGPNRADNSYDAGQRAFDQHKYDEAVQHFDAVVNAKAPRADGALYWKAYALNRLGKRDDALAALAQLRRDYASSPWLKDAQVLEAEVKQNNGQPVSPAQETNDDIKLYAINGLMSSDPERAIPLIEGVLRGASAPNVKDRALFVLAQSRSPRAQTVLTDYAKGSGNPDLQLRAVEYLGMSGTKESQQQLASIYAGSSDTRLKNLIIQMLMNARAYDALLSIAKTEKDLSLRDSAIRDVASSKGAPLDGLLEVYAAADAQAKRAIVDGFTNRRDAKTLVDLARKESDAAMKKTIVERLSSMHDNKDAMDYMMELLK